MSDSGFEGDLRLVSNKGREGDGFGRRVEVEGIKRDCLSSEGRGEEAEEDNNKDEEEEEEEEEEGMEGRRAEFSMTDRDSSNEF